MPPRIILRSVPEDDMEAMIEELQTKYPAQCKAMQAPITNIHEYFDNYDQHLHGQMFLHTVLMEIYFRNVIRRRAILDYTEAWSRLNPAAFECIYEYELNAFTEDDVEEYGEDFLQEVLQELQLRKSKREEAGQYNIPSLPEFCLLTHNQLRSRTKKRMFRIRSGSNRPTRDRLPSALHKNRNALHMPSVTPRLLLLPT